jgi:dTDP-4-amino-4,6-dideoxygalactose transaminase
MASRGAIQSILTEPDSTVAPAPAVPALLPVARPSLPRFEALAPYLRRIDEGRWYSNFGPLLNAFEARLADRFGHGAQVVTVVNATQALTLTLLALDLPRGALCMVPSYTFVATAHAVVAAGLTPWFVDVDPADWMLSPGAARDLLAAAPGEVRAVVPVAAFGAAPDIAGWKALREETGIEVVIDAAAAFDTACDCALPTIVSLHATKALGVGEGGFLATSDVSLAERVRRLTTFGFHGERLALVPATNAKLSEYAAAVGLAALDDWPTTRLRYLRASQFMRMALSQTKIGFQPGWGADWITSVCVVRLPAGARAAEVEARLEADGVQTRRWWGGGCHANPAFQGHPHADLTATETLAATVLGLPFAVDLDAHEASCIALALERALDAGRG